jgi:MFS family permease
MAHDPYAPLRRPGFRRFLGASLSVNLAGQMLRLTAANHLYTATHSAWTLALVGLTNYLPILLFSLPSGWAADHFPKRAVMATAAALQAAAVLGLCAVVAWGGPIWAWFPLLFLAGTGRAMNSPAAASFYPQLVEESEVPRAVSWDSSMFQAGSIVGPLLGGVLLWWLGPVKTLLIVALGPLIQMSLLPGFHILRDFAKPKAEPLKERMLGGFRFVWKERPILGAMSVDFVAVLFGGVVGILAMYAVDILHCGAVGQGALTSAPYVGALIMSFFLVHKPNLQRPGRAMLTAVAGFGVCMLVFGISRNLWLSLAALTLSGMLDQISVYVRRTMVQLRTPEELRGRVQAVNFLFIGSSNELGEVESSVTAGWFGPVGSVVFGGLAVLGVVAAAANIFPEFRKMETLGPKSGA